MFLELFTILVHLIHCSAQQLHPVELDALRDIRRQLSDAPGSSFMSTWDFTSGEPCTSFSGVVCTIVGQNSHVVMLNLGDGYAGSPGLTGKLSHRIGDLGLLQQLTLVPGSVRGSLPSSLGQLSSLEFLGIGHNQISGCIPDSLSNLARLQVLDLNSNALTCSIPHKLGLLPSLALLELSHNNLTGTVPEFVSSTTLTRLDMSWNSLSGELPRSFPPSLTYLSLKMNRLKGSISSLSSLTQLTTLDLSSNDLSGEIPSAIINKNPSLDSLLLQRNQFSGPINSVQSPVKVNVLDLSYNRLSGEIPPMFAYAENVYLNNNRFTGAVPREFTDGLVSANLRNLYLQHNFLTGFENAPPDAQLPPAALLCIQYNCLTPPSQSACPLNAGRVSSRPMAQCPDSQKTQQP